MRGFFISIFLLILITFDQNMLVALNDPEGGETGKSDTVKALVISENSDLSSSIENMSGEEIFHLIDSLLDKNAVPVSLIQEINEYAESRYLKHDYYVSLTSFYDPSIYPAQGIYGEWNTEVLHSYKPEDELPDTLSCLILEDTANYCNFNMPVEGILTSPFGWRDGKNHNGIDIDLHVWDPVHAAFDGMVRIAKYHGGYGRVVVIRHYNGLETLYAHLHRLKVKPGDIVESGQVIGLGGSSGNSTGSHLHFEMRLKGKPLNPLSIVSLKEGKLYNDTILLKKNRWSYVAIPKGVKYHTVKRGDFLYRISKQYGVSINELCELNGIRRNSVLQVGRKLRISS
ncbi:MAG: M23 family metallopeptidase [Vicingaceae bacterium]